MASCQPWTYLGVNQQVFQALQSAGRKRGFTIPTSSSGIFTIHTSGVKVNFRYSWNKSNRTLLLECISKPAVISCSMIKSIADKMVLASGGTPK